MQILRHRDLPLSELGEERRYTYKSNHLRIIETHIPPGHVQNWHGHDHHADVTVVLSGEVEVSELADPTEVERAAWTPLGAGDLVNFSPGPYHNVRNRSADMAVMLTFKPRWPDDITPGKAAELAEDDRRPLPVAAE